MGQGERSPSSGVEVTVTGKEQLECWLAGSRPPVEEVRPGLWSVPVPIPDNPLRYVLSYFLESDRGIAVVDPGWNTPASWDALLAGFDACGASVSDTSAIIVTHIHPDHYGLAGRLRQASGAPVALHPADAAQIPARYGERQGEILVDMNALLVRAGVPSGQVAPLTESSLGIREFVELVEPDILLGDGDMAPAGKGWQLRAIWTPGHSPGHLSFYEERLNVLLSGDHVLPRITPNVSLHVESGENPLADYLASLDKVEQLVVNEVLPAHEWRFSPLSARVSELRQHHESRLAELLAVLRAKPLTVWEVTQALTWALPFSAFSDFMKRAAVGESLAHLVFLEKQGRVQRQSAIPEVWSLP